MLEPTQTPAEDDPLLATDLFHTDAPRRRLQTRQAAMELAQATASRDDMEWLVIFYLNAHDDIVDTHEPIYSARCPPALHPWDFFRQAQAVGATSLVIVRYHPHHWHRYSDGAAEGYQAWQAVSQQTGIGIKESLHIDSRGIQFSCRGRDWGNGS